MAGDDGHVLKYRDYLDDEQEAGYHFVRAYEIGDAAFGFKFEKKPDECQVTQQLHDAAAGAAAAARYIVDVGCYKPCYQVGYDDCQNEFEYSA